MRKSSIIILIFGLIAVGVLHLSAQPGAEKSGKNQSGQSGMSQDQREIGIAVLLKAEIGEGKLTFTVATGGCTDKSSFQVQVKKEPGFSPKSSHYLLTVVRIKTDECKAFLPEGVEIAFDLEKDIGLSGAFTVSLSNPINPAKL